jgi:hypothetical protein
MSPALCVTRHAPPGVPRPRSESLLGTSLPSVRVVSALAGVAGGRRLMGVWLCCRSVARCGWVGSSSRRLRCFAFASPRFGSSRRASPLPASCRVAAPRLASCRVVSRRVASCRVVSRRVALACVALACVALSRLALSRLALACCASCRLPCGASRGASLPCPGVCFGGRVCRPMYGWTGFRLCGREVVGWLSGFTSGRRALWGCFVVTDRMYPSCGT